MKKKRWVAWLGSLLILCLAGCGIFVLSFGFALLQEKDTFAVIVAAARLKITGAEIENVGSSGQRWLMRTGHRYAPLDAYLGKRGWVHTDQVGATGTYKRNGQANYIRFKMYTRQFMICQADRQP